MTELRSPPVIVTLLCGSVGVVAFAAAAFLGGHHPLWPTPALAAIGLWAAAVVWRQGVWLFALPALLPLLNFSPWTGWIVVDESDLLVLATLAGGYLRWAYDLSKPGAAARPALLQVVRSGCIPALLLGALGLLGLYRGLADAGMAFDGYQGYADPLNSLRIFKPLLYALLLWPLLRQQVQASPQRAGRLLGAGMLLGLGVVTLAALWERAAFPGLWDFSTRYRTTALFWEMHVGGAAIDAYLALSMPFLAWALWTAKSPARWTAAAVLAVLAFYACLTTFSRGVYLAVALPMLGLGLLFLALRLTFRARALLLRALAYTSAGALTAVVLFVALEYFGFAGIAAVLLGLLLLLVASKRRSSGWRRAAGLGLALALLLEVVLVFGTGNFMLSRLAAGDRDFGTRLAHWGNGLSLLRSPSEWAWGIGLGRLPATYARLVPGGEFSGAARWVRTPQGGGAVELSGPKTRGKLGGLFALTQRVPMQAEAAYQVQFDVRVRAPTHVELSVCETHLLYDGRCQWAELHIQPGDKPWQPVTLALQGSPLPEADGYAPRLRVFALSVLNAGGLADFDHLRLIGADGTNLLRNGDFEDELAHWLPAAQYYFLPWHIDNLYLELLIERGLVGLALFLGLAGLALWNLCLGPGRRQPIAPFLAASLCGALIVGMVSSVMDVPRVALLLCLLMSLALSLEGGNGRDVASG